MEKQKLLDLAIFIDNEYLDKYIYLINNYNKQYTKFETQRHHIIPRAYFKHNKIITCNPAFCCKLGELYNFVANFPKYLRGRAKQTAL